ncbi:MAG TPA: metal-dependent hydrolase [Ktedonobacterales bacterium]
MNGSSHVVFGVAGAVAMDSFLHLSGPAIFGGSTAVTGALVAQKAIFYGFAALGALAPDIDNARSTIGKRAGILSKGIQHFAGHRRLFHSIVGLVLVGAIIWGAQYGIGLALERSGADRATRHLGEVLTGASGFNIAQGLGIAFVAFLVGYFLHLVADSLTIGGVPWLWPSHERFGFPPNHKWRFKSGTWVEKVVVVVVSLLVIGWCVFRWRQGYPVV